MVGAAHHQAIATHRCQLSTVNYQLNLVFMVIEGVRQLLRGSAKRHV
jgi:hypothetical protein